MNKLTEKGSFISKQESVMLQAVAVILMVWHHLFGFPERVHVPCVLVFDSLFHIETLLSYFGRICIAVFAFCSGYGMQKKAAASGRTGWKGIAGNYVFSVRHLRKFYCRYWLVFFAFVPLGLILNRYPVNVRDLVKSFLGFHYVYNAEWWYIGRYVIVIAMFPVLSALLQWLDDNARPLFHAAVAAAVAGWAYMGWHSLYAVSVCFLEGMYFAHTSWFEKIAAALSRDWQRLPAGLILTGLVFVLRTLGVTDNYLVPAFVFGVVLLLKHPVIGKYCGKVLLWIGRYSTYIWLTHTFFAYYYFQAFTYAPRYSWLIAIWCILLCIITGAALERIQNVFVRVSKNGEA